MSTIAPDHILIGTAAEQAAGKLQARNRKRHAAGFWIVAAAFLAAMAFSTVPAPLYPLYQARDGFSSLMVTVIFAAYAVGVVASLILAGHVSDWLGRRRVLIPALGLEILAGVIFLVWPAAAGLIIARLITGLGVGMLTATATAYLHELHAKSRPNAGPGRFELVSTAATIGGLGLGSLIAGALAEWAPAPLHTPYLFFVAVLILSVIGVGVAPETVQRPDPRPRYRPQRISADHGDRTRFLVASAALFTSFAIFGLFTSLAPGFVAGELHHPSRAFAGLVVFVVFGAAALTQTVLRGIAVGVAMAIGLAAQAVGLIVLAVGVQADDLTAFLIGGAVAGAGAGLLFKSSVGQVAAMAESARRGEALATLFLAGYLGLIIPALGLGVATQFVSVETAMLWFAGALLVLIAGAAGTQRWASRRA